LRPNTKKCQENIFQYRCHIKIYSYAAFNAAIHVRTTKSFKKHLYYYIISASFSQENLQEKIYKSLKNTHNVLLINKNMPIDTYASLIDFCDCFISSDTGGLHIAASYKFDEYSRPLNNKPAIFSIFGATPATIYAYDSFKENFLKSSQNAISKVYISKNACKNITCINKAAKKCKSVRCFYGINYQEIVTDIKNYLDIDA